MQHQQNNIPSPRSKYKGQKWKHYNTDSPHKKQKWNPKSPQSSNNKTDLCTRCRDTKHQDGFYCPAGKFKCQHCHKTGHFMNCCFKKQRDNNNKQYPSKKYIHRSRTTDEVTIMNTHQMTVMTVMLLQIHLHHVRTLSSLDQSGL